MMEEPPPEDHYSDLRSFIHGATAAAGTSSVFSAPLTDHDMLIFNPTNINANLNTNPPPPPPSSGAGGRDHATGRWPRQETLTLLEIRASLDSKFKETNQKGPLWDQVSRIMSEQHGYQRSGKKCREKFENLYKYYKKIKERKAGRQDGRHYRFFRQLEALYGESYNNYASTSNAENKPMETSLSLSNYSEESSSDESDDANDDDDYDENDAKTKTIRRWKSKIKDFIDANMKKLVDKQEAWMDKMMRAIEDKDRERILREEDWRRQDAARIEQEQLLWARERVWIEARDSALMEALHKLAGKEQVSLRENQTDNRTNTWSDSEINELIQLRTSMEMKFQQRVISENILWEEIAAKMACFGHERRSPLMCKEKWDEQLKCINKRRKENSRNCTYYEPFAQQGGILGGGYASNEGGFEQRIIRLGDHHGSSLPNTGAATLSESCFRYLMGDGYGRIID